MSTLHYKFVCGLTALILILVIQGCASNLSNQDGLHNYTPSSNTVGILQIQGANNVWVNSQKVNTPSIEIHSNDYIQIGAQSSAYLHYLGGGYIHFDENTDPVIQLIWQQTSCFINMLKFTYGQIASTTNHQCDYNVETKFGKWLKHGSEFNLKTDNQRSVLTVLNSGMVLVKPQYIEMSKGQQITVSNLGVESLVELTAAQLIEVSKWRTKYPEPPAPEESSINWWAVGAGIVAVGAGVAAAILFNQHGDPPSTRPPSSGTSGAGLVRRTRSP